MSTTPHNNFARIAEDWVQIFASGPQTDSAGNSREWTAAEIEQMAANFDANDSFPIVVGHPKTDSPAFGWASALKAEGGKLFARFRQIAPAFLAWGKAGHIRNRSVKIVQGANGYRVAHVGFLGAAPPAVEGMEAIQFSADAGQVFEFSLGEGWSLSLIARFMRRMREWLIETDGMETADRLAPDYEIESFEQIAADAAAAQRAEPPIKQAFNASHGKKSEKPMTVTHTFTQADLDAAVEQARQAAEAAAAATFGPQIRAAEFARRVAANRVFVDGLVKDKSGLCRLTPAQAVGVAEFLSSLDGLDVEVAEFSFSAEDKVEKKVTLAQFVRDLLGGLPPQLQLGRERATHDAQLPADHSFSAPSGTVVSADRVALFTKAKHYQATHPNTDWTDAVKAVGG